MVSTRPPASMSSSPFDNPLVIVPKAPITIGIIITFMWQSFFFQFSSKVTLFQFYSVVSQHSKVNNFANSVSFIWWGDYY